jgi:hypothetical protein
MKRSVLSATVAEQGENKVQIQVNNWLLLMACCISLLTVVPASVFICVKMGTAAFFITKAKFFRKDNNSNE